jgi:hypothetical protein
MRFSAGVVAAAVIFGATASATPPAPGHPVLGTWQVLVVATDCIETWTFLPDGTTRSQSVNEDSNSVYTISDQPAAGGYYTVVDRITKTNGGIDCSGQPGAPLGDVATVYLAPRGEGKMALCMDKELKECPGLMVKVASPAP